jgi:hypothetical protein
MGRKAQGGSPGEKTIRQRHQLALAVGERYGLAPRFLDECPYAPLGFEYTGAFQLAVHLGDGVGVDPQIDSELPDCG